MKDIVSNCPICPECKKPLILSIDASGSWSRKIGKDGSLHKTVAKSVGYPMGASFLECKHCTFSYDTEHSSQDTPIPELDAWISKNLESISNWKN